MRWLLLAAVLLAAAVEGLVLDDWPILDVKLPLTWLALALIMLNQWDGWRQTLVSAVLAGYLLDVLAAPAHGAVLLPMLAAWLVGQLILKRFQRAANAKLGALIAGSLVYSSGFFAVGPYWPGWRLAAHLSLFLLVTLAGYWMLQTAALSWLKRL